MNEQKKEEVVKEVKTEEVKNMDKGTNTPIDVPFVKVEDKKIVNNEFIKPTEKSSKKGIVFLIFIVIILALLIWYAKTHKNTDYVGQIDQSDNSSTEENSVLKKDEQNKSIFGNLLKNKNDDSAKAVLDTATPYLGIHYFTITPDIKEANNLSIDYGALVKGDSNTNQLAVIPGSPADKAGIVENDIILEVDGVKLDQNTELASLILKKKIGDIITFKILHRGVEKTVQVTLEVNPSTEK